eukprot:scaffold236838_cov61-Attheya_sp.AAC.1
MAKLVVLKDDYTGSNRRIVLKYYRVQFYARLVSERSRSERMTMVSHAAVRGRGSREDANNHSSFLDFGYVTKNIV